MDKKTIGRIRRYILWISREEVIGGKDVRGKGRGGEGKRGCVCMCVGV